MISPEPTKEVLTTQSIVLFVALQALDVITTLLGLRAGAIEANVVVAHLMRLGPTAGLLLAKLLGFVIVVAVFALGKVRFIRLLNIWFAGLVTWNLIMIWIQRLGS